MTWRGTGRRQDKHPPKGGRSTQRCITQSTLEGAVIPRACKPQREGRNGNQRPGRGMEKWEERMRVGGSSPQKRQSGPWRGAVAKGVRDGGDRTRSGSGEENRKVRGGRQPPSPELETQTGEQRHRQSKQGTEGSGERARPGMGSSQKRERRDRGVSRDRGRRRRRRQRSAETHRERAGLAVRRNKLDRARARPKRHMKWRFQNGKTFAGDRDRLGWDAWQAERMRLRGKKRD